MLNYYRDKKKHISEYSEHFYIALNQNHEKLQENFHIEQV